MFAAVSCLAAAVVAGLGAVTLARSGTAERLAERQQAMLAAAASFRSVLSTAEAELASVADVLGDWSGDADDEVAARTLLGGPLPLGVVDAVLVAGADGIVIAADGPSAASVGGRADDAVLQALVDGPVVTGPLADRDGAGTIRIAVPLHDADGTPSGVLVGAVAGDGLLAQTTASLAATDAAPRLVWHDGTVLGADGRFGRELSLRAPAQLAADGVGVQRLTAPAGARLVTAFAPLTGGWAVVSSQPAATFDAPARRPVVLTLAAVLFVVAGAALGVTWAFARSAATRREVEAARRSLLAVAGHELRTPLTVVSGGLQTLDRRWDDLSEQRKRDVLVFARRHARRLEHQVERLLFAAQLDRKAAFGATPRMVDAVALVRDAVDEQAPLAPAHRFVVEADGPSTVTVDVRAMEQVLFHLLENAVRYSPAGGTVRVRVARRGGSVDLIVEDDGVGLPSDTSQLFERFGQVEEVDTRVLGEGGLGLGLHIVRTLVERQRGTVTAAARPAGGAAFTVTLPATFATEPVPGDGAGGTRTPLRPDTPHPAPPVASGGRR